MRGWITDPNATNGLRLADDLPEPQPLASEAVIEVKAFSVNRGELTLIKTRPDGFRPGQDIAGVVLQACEGSPPVGTRVVAIVDWHGWAERVAAPVNWIAPLPDNVTFAAASTLPVAGLTALRGVRGAGSIVGRRVLVTGATGGVGQFAVQIAVAGGAHVTAQVSSEQRFDEAKELGAHETVVAVEADGVGPFYLVMEGVGGTTLVESLHKLEPGGTMALYGTVGGKSEIALADFRSAPGSRLTPMFLRNSLADRIGDELGALAQLIGDGRLKPLIGLSMDWTRTPDVIAALGEREVRGKAVLTRE